MRAAGGWLGWGEEPRLLGEHEVAVIDEVIAEVGSHPGALAAVLSRLAAGLGELTPEVEEAVALRLGVSAVAAQEVGGALAEVWPRAGRVLVCGGGACTAAQGSAVADQLRQHSHGSAGPMVGVLPCLGACWAAPVAQSAEGRRDRLTPATVGQLASPPGGDRSRRRPNPSLRGVVVAPWRSDELAQIRARLGERMARRAQGWPGEVRELLVCRGGGCCPEAAERVAEVLSRTLAEVGLDRTVRVVRVGCRGEDLGRVAIDASPAGWSLRGADEGTAAALVSSLAVDPTAPPPGVAWRKELTLKAGVTRRFGRVDPCSLEEYVASEGFVALEKVVTTPGGKDWAARALCLAGWRRRGEAEGALSQPLGGEGAPGGGTVVCPCGVGEAHLPADALLLASDPFAVIEGVVLAGLLGGCRRGVLMPPAGWSPLLEQVELAVALARRRGLLGRRILGSQFDFDLTVTPVPRRLVAGDESALCSWALAGQALRPAPRTAADALPRALVVDPESAARLCAVLGAAQDDPAAGAAVAEQRLVTVVEVGGGAAVVEVAASAGLGEIISLGVAAKRAGVSVGAVLCGGLGGVFRRAGADLARAGEYGTLVVLPQDACPVALVADLLTTLSGESCGGCAAGRLGVQRMRDCWRQLAAGAGDEYTVREARQLAEHVAITARCTVGRGAARLAHSALAEFAPEVESHLVRGSCPGLRCAVS